MSFPVFADTDPLPPLPPPVSPEEQRALTLFTEVFRIIRDHYWEEVSPQVLIEGAIAGMLARLDPYAAFHPRGTGKRAVTPEPYGGIGIRIAQQGERLVITAVRRGGPAAQAGVRKGDELLAVDDLPVKGRREGEVAASIRGIPGTTVTLQLRRGEETLLRRVTRARIEPSFVYGETLPLPGGGLAGYLRIERFAAGSAAAFRRELDRLLAASIGGILLDLRGNGGGTLEEGKGVAAALLPPGSVVARLQSRDPALRKVVTTKETDRWVSLPLVILVDPRTASVAEIVAAALQAGGGGIVIGAAGGSTFGKGVGQFHFPLRSPWPPGDSALPYELTLSTVRFLTPSGRPIAGLGVETDVEVMVPEEVWDALSRFGLPGVETYPLSDPPFPDPWIVEGRKLLDVHLRWETPDLRRPRVSIDSAFGG